MGRVGGGAAGGATHPGPTVSPARQEIVSAIEAAGEWLSPAEVAERLGKNKETIKNLNVADGNEGQLANICGTGRYGVNQSLLESV